MASRFRLILFKDATSVEKVLDQIQYGQDGCVTDSEKVGCQGSSKGNLCSGVTPQATVGKIKANFGEFEYTEAFEFPVEPRSNKRWRSCLYHFYSGRSLEETSGE